MDTHDKDMNPMTVIFTAAVMVREMNDLSHQKK